MIKKNGFTIIELLITLVMMAVLFGAIGFVYRACFKAIIPGQSRSQIRTELSQAFDVQLSDFLRAQNITSCSATGLTYWADLGLGPATQTYTLSSNNLQGTSGAMIASSVQPNSTSVSWGTTPSLFSCTNGLVTTDMTAVSNGENIHFQTYLRPRNVPVGLVGWWALNDAGSGTCTTTVNDYSGNGNLGTCHASPTWTRSGKTGNAMTFVSASSKYLSLPTSATITDGLSAATWSVWFNPTTEAASQDLITKWAASYAHIILRVNSSGAVYVYVANALGDAGSNYGYTVNSQVVTGAWNQIIVIYNGAGVGNSGILTVFVNGNQETLTFAGTIPSTLTSPGTNASYYIGANNGTSNYVNGSMDDVRVYNRAINNNEVWELYNEE